MLTELCGGGATPLLNLLLSISLLINYRNIAISVETKSIYVLNELGGEASFDQ